MPTKTVIMNDDAYISSERESRGRKKRREKSVIKREGLKIHKSSFTACLMGCVCFHVVRFQLEIAEEAGHSVHRLISCCCRVGLQTARGEGCGFHAPASTNEK